MARENIDDSDMCSRVSIIEDQLLIESESGEELDLKGQNPKMPTKLVERTDTMLTTTPASLLTG